MESRLDSLPEVIRIDEEGKLRLQRLRRVLGVDNWNVICRLAYTKAVSAGLKKDYIFGMYSNIEISWKTLVGAYDNEFKALTTLHEGQSIQQMIHLGLSMLDRELSKSYKGSAMLQLIEKFSNEEA